MSSVVRATRSDEVRRRTQNIQKMLLLRDPEPLADPAAAISAAFSGPPPCRAALAHWPDEWREQWGILANALEDSGLPWHEAEARAFVEIWSIRRAQAKSEPRAMVSADPERN